MHVHTPKESVYENENPAACTVAGSREAVVYCETCGEEIKRTTETVSALGHDWGEWETVEDATCGVDGLRRRVCRREGCTAEEEQTIPATGEHVLSDESVIENYEPETCTKSETFDEVMYCKVCGAELNRYPYSTDAPGHDWGEWQITQEPTCTEKGRQQRTCRRCDEVDEEFISANGHTAVEAYLPTCTEAGYTGRTVCLVCGEVVDEGEPAPALGGEHEYIEQGEPFTQTYVNEYGVTMVQQLQALICTRCGYGYTYLLGEWEEGAHAIDPGY